MRDNNPRNTRYGGDRAFLARSVRRRHRRDGAGRAAPAIPADLSTRTGNRARRAAVGGDERERRDGDRRSDGGGPRRLRRSETGSSHAFSTFRKIGPKTSRSPMLISRASTARTCNLRAVRAGGATNDPRKTRRIRCNVRRNSFAVSSLLRKPIRNVATMRSRSLMKPAPISLRPAPKRSFPARRFLIGATRAADWAKSLTRWR